MICGPMPSCAGAKDRGVPTAMESAAMLKRGGAPKRASMVLNMKDECAIAVGHALLDPPVAAVKEVMGPACGGEIRRGGIQIESSAAWRGVGVDNSDPIIGTDVPTTHLEDLEAMAIFDRR